MQVCAASHALVVTGDSHSGIKRPVSVSLQKSHMRRKSPAVDKLWRDGPIASLLVGQTPRTLDRELWGSGKSSSDVEGALMTRVFSSRFRLSQHIVGRRHKSKVTEGASERVSNERDQQADGRTVSQQTSRAYEISSISGTEYGVH